MNIHEFINIIESASRELTDSTLEKKLIRVYNPIDEYDIGCIVNYVIDLNKYEVYMFAARTKDKIISNVGTKVFDDEKSSNIHIYFKSSITDTNFLNSSMV